MLDQVFCRSWKSALVWGGLVLALSATALPASATGSWEVKSVEAADDGTGRVLWIKPGTTDTNGVYSGDTASVWSINAQGSESAEGPAYGPYQGWRTRDLHIAPDGTTRLEWVKTGTYDSNDNYSGDTVSLWTLNSKGIETAEGPSFGPYAGWQSFYFEVAHDSTVHLYWDNYSSNINADSVSVWRLSATGTLIAQGPALGPYPGWSSYYGQTASDDTIRLEWVKAGTIGSNGVSSGDQVSIWVLNTNGTQTTIGPSYGPYYGWTVDDGFALASDNTGRLNWTKPTIDPNTMADTGDAASVWTISTAGTETAVGPTYGPYTGWQSQGVAVAPDGTTRMQWLIPGTTDNNGNFSGDELSFWTLNSYGVATAQGPAYGPYAGWSYNDGGFAPDSTLRINWIKAGTTDANSNYSGDISSVWALNSAGKETSIGPSYGPYQNWSVVDIYPETSSLTYLVWNHNTPGDSEGYIGNGDEFSIWSLNGTGSTTLIGPTYGPF